MTTGVRGQRTLQIFRVPVIMVLLFRLSGCVGSARTTNSYHDKASGTVRAAVSALQTALLAVQLSRDGKLLGPYLNVVLTQAENDFGSVQQSFDSIQPPAAAAADRMRDTLDGLLSAGAGALSQLRILGRRGDEPAMVQTAADLPPLVDRFNVFAQELAS